VFRFDFRFVFRFGFRLVFRLAFRPTFRFVFPRPCFSFVNLLSNRLDISSLYFSESS
jgi:hypothetical protein